MKKLYESVVVVAASLALAQIAFAQNYPARPIRVVVGFQAGGAVDLAARAVSKQLTDSIGQSVIVDNRAGAAGNIAADIVAKSAPDGYTLLMANVTLAIPSLFTKLPFDIMRDFSPVSLIAIGPSVLVVHPSVPVKTVKQLIALAKAKPKQLIYGSGGLGNITHLEMELLTSSAGIEMLHVPYKGGAPSVVGLLSGEVHVLFTSIPSVLAQLNSGRIRALGVSTAKRSNALPNVPTVAEAGVPGYDAASWYGLFAPNGVAPATLAVLSKEIVKIMRVAEVRDRFAADGFDPVGGTPEEFAQFLQAEVPKWAQIVRAAGIKAE